MTTTFRGDERGAIAFLMLVLSIGILTLMGLVMDTGRGYSAHTQMQSYTDNVALAMASELDGKPGARTRALSLLGSEGIEYAASRGFEALEDGVGLQQATVEKRSPLLREGDDFAIKPENVVFLRQAPPARGSKLAFDSLSTYEAASDAEAEHVVVLAEPREVSYTLLHMRQQMFNYEKSNAPGDGESIKDTNPEAYYDRGFSFSAWASADLVNEEDLINETLMICAETDENGNFTGAFADLEPGQQIRFAKSRDGDWSVGTYGVATTLADDAQGTCETAVGTDITDPDVLACRLALNDPVRQPADGRFVSAMGDQLLEGEDTLSVHAGMNVRFGVYDKLVDYLQSSTNASSDLNTIAGDLYTCTDHDYDRVSQSSPSPIDPCFVNGTCSFVSPTVTATQIGNYCDITHDGACPQTAEGEQPTTRYELYLAELHRDWIDPVGAEQSGADKADICNPNADPFANRRVIEVAFVDCSDIPEGEIMPTNVPVLAYAEVFLSNPVNSSDYFVAGFETDGLTAGDVVSKRSKFGGSNYQDRKSEPYWNDAGLRIDVIQSHDGRGYDINAPMVFDTTTGTEEDPDLEHTGRGNILIISEDGDPVTPDDEGKGGTFVFHFKEPTYVHSLVVFDTEGGGTIRTFSDNPNKGGKQRPHLDGGCGEANRLLLDLDDTIPDWATGWWDCITLALHALGEDDTSGEWNDSDGLKEKPSNSRSLRKLAVGEDKWVAIDADGELVEGSTEDKSKLYVADPDDDNPHDDWLIGMPQWAKGVPHLKDNDQVQVLIQQEDVLTLTYTMHGDSGAVDNLVFWSEITEHPEQRDEVYVEFLDYITEEDPRVLTYSRLSN